MLQAKIVMCNFIGIKPIVDVDTRVNFIIKCADQQELNSLMEILNVKKKGVLFEDVIDQLKQNSEES